MDTTRWSTPITNRSPTCSRRASTPAICAVASTGRCLAAPRTGHCINAGRYTVIYALTGDLVPSHPCSFNDIADLCAEEDGTFMWDNPETAMDDILVW